MHQQETLKRCQVFFLATQNYFGFFFCFSEILSPIGVDNIHSYPVEELNDGALVLHARPSTFKNYKRVPQFAICDLNADKRTFVVVGGGWKQKQKKK